jgi:hypothetical protein
MRHDKLTKETLSLMWFQLNGYHGEVRKNIQQTDVPSTDRCTYNQFSKETIIHVFLRRYNLWSEHQQLKDELKHYHWWRMCAFLLWHFQINIFIVKVQTHKFMFQNLVEKNQATRTLNFISWNIEIWSLKLIFWFYCDFGMKMCRFRFSWSLQLNSGIETILKLNHLLIDMMLL